jgi:tetratricopeptide (TPR) repeat protein
MNLNGPLWFRRGIDGFFSTVTSDHDTLTFGKQGDWWGHEMKLHGWLGWPQFFRITGRSPEYIKDSPTHIQFRDQADLVVHYFLTNPEPGWTPRLFAWVAYLEAGNDPTEQSFKQFFGFGWEDLQHRLEHLLDGGKYTAGSIRFPPAALQFPVEISEAHAREMRELFVLSQIENQNTNESDASLDALLARGLKTESLREVLADACGRRGRTDAQLQELRRLISLRSTNAAVYTDAANILFRRRQVSYTLDSRLDGEEGDEVRAWCQKAIKLEPLYVKADELLAWGEAFAPTVEKRNIETIAGICRVLEGNARTYNVLTALAIAQWRMGNMAEARSLAERILASDLSGRSAKQLARELLARLNTPPQAVATPPATQAENPRVAK